MRNPRLEEVLKKADRAIEEGWTIHFKFTCSRCKERVVLNDPNTIYETGECCECGGVTELRGAEANLGFLVVARLQE